MDLKEFIGKKTHIIVKQDERFLHYNGIPIEQDSDSILFLDKFGEKIRFKLENIDFAEPTK